MANKNMSIMAKKGVLTKDVLGTIDDKIGLITQDWIKEQTYNSPNLRFVRSKKAANIIRDGKQGYSVTGILFEHTNKGPKQLLCGRIDIFGKDDYDIHIAIRDKSYAAAAETLTERLRESLYE